MKNVRESITLRFLSPNPAKGELKISVVSHVGIFSKPEGKQPFTCSVETIRITDLLKREEEKISTLKNSQLFLFSVD